MSADGTWRSLYRCASAPSNGTCAPRRRAVPQHVQTRLSGQLRAGPFILPSPLPSAHPRRPGGGDHLQARPMPGAPCPCDGRRPGGHGVTGEPGRGQAVCTSGRGSKARPTASRMRRAVHARRRARYSRRARRQAEHVPFIAHPTPRAARPGRRPLCAEWDRSSGCRTTPDCRY